MNEFRLKGKVSMNEHEKINYVEYPAEDIASTKRFFEINAVGGHSVP